MSLTLPIEIRTSSGELVASITEGGAESKNGHTVATLTLHNGDLINVRNVQGGTMDNPNLDLGAGSTEHPGDIVMNWDVGRSVLAYDGHEHKVFGINESKGGHRHNHSYLPLRLHRGALIPNGHGGWKPLT